MYYKRLNGQILFEQHYEKARGIPFAAVRELQ